MIKNNNMENNQILDIVYHPDPILRQTAQEIDLDKIKSPAMQAFMKNLEATMLKKDGAGLAAPQVGISQRVIAVAQRNKKNLIMINPVITRRSWKKVSEEEGCLSVVDENGKIIYGRVSRHRDITCQYFDAQGKKKKLKAEEYLARVIQHEVDHLNGVLFIDYLEK